jgi:hypothetical protein
MRARKVPTGPLSERMEKVLVALLVHDPENRGLTNNRIGHLIGFRTGSDRLAHDGRMMGAANRVNACVMGLERRGLVCFARRRDGLSGTAYRLTPEGLIEARRIKSMELPEGYRTGAENPDLADVVAVWLEEGYTPEDGFEDLNLEPVRAGDLDFLPGNNVEVEEEHEMYPGEPGVVKAAGKGTGLHGGEIVYDVLIEGTSHAERFTAQDLTG